MGKREELKGLFEEWRKEHLQENDKDYPKNAPKIDGDHVSANSFCEDGWLDNDPPKDTKILFILKESHVDSAEGCQTEQFWFQEVVNQVKPRKGAEKTYYSRLKSVADAIISPGAEPGEAFSPGCAYMNVNKRGGTGSCSNTVLKNYMHSFKKLIKKEIEIIDPKLILCCSTDKRLAFGDQIKEILDNTKYANRVMEIYHPQARVSNEKYVKQAEPAKKALNIK